MLLFPERLSFKGMGHVKVPLTKVELYDLGDAAYCAFCKVLSSAETMEAIGLNRVMQAIPSHIELDVALATKNRYRIERMKTSNSVWNDEQILGIISCDKFGSCFSEDLLKIRKWFNGSNPKNKRAQASTLKGAIASGFVFDDLKKIKIFFSASSMGQKICSYCEWKLKVPFNLINGKYEIDEIIAIGQVLELTATQTGCAGYVRVEKYGEIEADVKLNTEEERK